MPEKGRGVQSLARRFSWVAVLLALLLNARADALDPSRSIAQFKHSRWTTDEGVPTPVSKLVQGTDGYLWVASLDRLYRYDGLRFERIVPERSDPSRGGITTLFVAHDGAIWAGYANGGATVYRHGMLRETGMETPGPFVMRFAETRDGAIWAMLGRLDGSLARYTRGRWETVNSALGLPREHPMSMIATRDGTLWIATLQSLVFLPKGATRFRRAAATPSGHASLAEDPAGNVWISDDSGTRVVVSTLGRAVASRAYPTPAFDRATNSFFDTSGNLWGSNGRSNIFRVRAPKPAGPASAKEAKAAVEMLVGKEDGLLADAVYALTSDREGNIWVGTMLGLERFRAANVVVEPALTRAGTWAFALLGARDGTVYVGQHDGVYRVRPGGDPERLPGVSGDAYAFCEARDGAVWVVFDDHLVRLRGNRKTRVALPKHSAVRLYGCVMDKDDRLWLTADLDGIYQLSAGVWRHVPPMSPGDAYQMIGTDAQGHVIVIGSDDTFLRFDRADRPPVKVLGGKVLKNLWWFHQQADDLLFAGANGLVRLRDGRVATLPAERVPTLAAISGIAPDFVGNTWMMTASGIARVRTSALDHALDDPRAALQPLIFDVQDGLPGTHVRDGMRDVVRGGDGRIWFATSAGVVWVDPAQIVRNPVPPPVLISALKAGGVTYRDPGAILLPAGTSKGDIDYSALSLSIPQRVQVRYKLEGMDEDWVDPGSRRQMFFSNLGPGTYRFRVIASNNDGVWNRSGATLEFTIPPTFFQSLWFKLLCALVAIILTAFAYKLHLRRVTAQLRATMEVRLAERERIARELHDTLLQSFQGLVLRFQMVANQMPKSGPLHQLMETALDKSDEVLVDVRDKVQDLRVSTGDGDLANGLLLAAGELGNQSSTAFRFVEEGTPRQLHAIASDELRRIGEEALRNAFHHANAHIITLAINYGGRHLWLSVSDDGIGLPEHVAANGERAGHFGLIGMRERAGRVGGTLVVSSREGFGTEIRVTVPAKAAYSGKRRWRWPGLARVLAGD